MVADGDGDGDAWLVLFYIRNHHHGFHSFAFYCSSPVFNSPAHACADLLSQYFLASGRPSTLPNTPNTGTPGTLPFNWHIVS